jgi:hypothetical protein
MGRLVAAGAERLVARTGKDDDADRPIPAGALEGVDQFVHGAAPERVVALGAVDGDAGDALGAHLVQDVFVVAHGLPPGRIDAGQGIACRRNVDGRTPASR